MKMEIKMRTDEALSFRKWWPETGLNRRRRPFQGRALPLSYLALGVPKRTWTVRCAGEREPAGYVYGGQPLTTFVV